ncbi:MAG: hypothetical protein ACKVE4_09040 [Dissulfuribacterales bacterium]
MLKKAFIALMAVLIMASMAPAMEIEDVNVPETLKAGDKLLVLNGAGESKKYQSIMSILQEKIYLRLTCIFR